MSPPTKEEGEKGWNDWSKFSKIKTGGDFLGGTRLWDWPWVHGKKGGLALLVHKISSGAVFSTPINIIVNIGKRDTIKFDIKQNSPHRRCIENKLLKEDNLLPLLDTFESSQNKRS